MNILIRMALERQRLEQRQIQEQRAYYEVRYIKYIIIQQDFNHRVGRYFT